MIRCSRPRGMDLLPAVPKPRVPPGPIQSRGSEKLKLMPEELPVLIAPRNRGAFSDRATWEAIHMDRLARYKAGETITGIAVKHGVKRRTVYYSIERCLSGMSAREADAIRAERWKRTGGYDWDWIFRRLNRLQREQSRLWRLLASVKV